MLVSERELDGPSGPAAVRDVIERAGPVAVHLRARLPTRRLFEIAIELAPRAVRTGGWLVVNGRPDVALAAGAHAVQLGRTALGVKETRRLVEACAGRLAIGASVHDAEGALRAVRDGADYLVLGTIYATPSHPGRAGRGPAAVTAAGEAVAAAARGRKTFPRERPTRSPGGGPSSGSAPPVLAIGGLRADRIGEVADAGAYGVVVGRAVWSAADPAEAARELRKRLHRRFDGDTDSGQRTGA
ncbi:thiamine phosphate synthase [Candidatus Palauibacter sp.]|uniref:thiamine phosphate synthase n=1 Tax=Candidatus Palauibacter sp. TaxID=3101350 RepID=UPI003B0275D3